MAQRANPPVKARQLYRFAKGVFIENIHVRPNGHLLLTTFDEGRLYTLHPNETDTKPRVVVSLPDVHKLTGIVEVAPDVFAVAAGARGAGFVFAADSGKVFTVDFNVPEGQEPAVKLVARVPEALTLNGMVGLPQNPHILLSVDSGPGRIFRIDTLTGAVDESFSDEKLTPGPKPMLAPVGGNGLLIRDGYLYFTNSGQQFVGRFPIDEKGSRTGAFEETFHFPEDSVVAPDDFAMSRDGTMYIACHVDSVVRVSPDSAMTTLLDDDTEVKIDHPTSVALSKDEKIAYVVSGGSFSGGESGSIAAVQL